MRNRLLQTKVIITPEDKYLRGEVAKLPRHIDVVRPLRVSEQKTDSLVGELGYVLKRKVFDICQLSENDIGETWYQKLGGSALHALHDDAITAANKLHIAHPNHPWVEGTTETWYQGNWRVPKHRVTISRIILAQEVADSETWQILKTVDMVPYNTDFRDDPETHRLYEELRAS